MNEKLLEYQKLDIELRKVKREFDNVNGLHDVDTLNANIKDYQ